MIDNGLLDEIRGLEGHRVGNNLRQAAGFDEMRAVLAGSMTLEAALERMEIRTRRLVKHQQTWMKRIPLTPIEASAPEALETLDRAFHHELA